MNSTRFPRTDDLETMKKLTQTLGVKLWDHAVVVLTFANMVLLSPSEKAKGVNEKDAFNSQFQCLKKRIQQALIKIGVPEDVAVNVPVVPTGDVCEPRLPDRDNWLTAFWVAAFNRINRNAKAAFLLSNADRIEFSPVLDADEENQESMAIRALENTFQGVAFEKDLVPSLPNPRPSVAARKSSSCPPQNQTVTRTASTIQLDEACSRSIINDMVGDVTGTSSGESKGPAFVRFYQPFLRWIIKYLRKLFRNRSGKEAGINADQSGGKK
ncbi:hypothetical protein OS493_023514 [Desmophyllum pertusum]|uniref:Uncharacterized protein n=1 Tax=Desmophyllum pertusum TaxID=174260 RepID=A0A9W9ZMM8_9CNID|nr:hypothetical protein OS493_023514 [Desmophyllum pertusum]